MNAHNTIVQAESNHREELERLAVELVMKEMGIPEGSIEFDAKIIGMGEVNTDDFNRDDNNEENPEEVDIDSDVDLGLEVELFNDLKGLDVEKAKRRLINSIIQGASNKGHYMYNLAPEKIGEITGNQIGDSSLMHYDATQGIYTKKIFLKQGYYSYTYATKDIKNPLEPADISFTDGNYWETENEYTILVYYRSFSGRHDELVGATTINSRLHR